MYKRQELERAVAHGGVCVGNAPRALIRQAMAVRVRLEDKRLLRDAIRVLEAALGTLRDNPDAYRAPVDDDECDEPAVAAS